MSTGSGVGGGAGGFAMARRRTSTRPVSPAATSTDPVQVSWSSRATSTRRVPGLSFRPERGVVPTGRPSTETAAPEGVERMSAVPEAGAAGRASATRTWALGEPASSVTERVCAS